MDGDQPADQPVTVHSLPQELLASILSHNFTKDDPPDLDTLKAASLVCRAWREPAQRLVWACGAELLSEDEMDAFVRTRPLRRGGPREMAVHEYKDRKRLKRVLGVCDGLRFLMVAVPERDFDANVFRVEQLADMHTLIVQARLLPIRSGMSFPFSLRTLVLADASLRSTHLAPFLVALQSTCIPSLRSIALPGFSPSAHPAVAEALLPFAPHLSHFGLSIRTKDDAKPYIPFLHAATALNSFECTALPPALLANLPPSLTVLATAEEAAVLDGEALSTAFDGLKCLKRLYFASSRTDFLKQVKGGQKLVDRMRERGVDWMFEGEMER
ncbi:hypothetical protein JCM10207_007133 [Rhodosporidiobolus poonsookiae]